jgi:hypothetical protein
MLRFRLIWEVQQGLGLTVGADYLDIVFLSVWIGDNQVAARHHSGSRRASVAGWQLCPLIRFVHGGAQTANER